MRRSRNSNEKG